MKCKYLFERIELDGEIVGVPTGESASEIHAVLNLNEEAMRILELLREETSERAVVAQLLKEYDSPEEVIAPRVHTFISQLRQEGFLEE